MADGLTSLDEAFALVDSTQERCWQAELDRIKGELLLAQSAENHARAEACFLRAVDVARVQEARSWELRAGIDLARLWRSQGKRSEARELLAPTYAWFSEGLDTADLRDANALLESLD